MEFDDKMVRFNIFDALKHPSEAHYVFHLDLLHEFNDTQLSNFLHDFHAPSLTDPYTCHACTNSETCSFCIDEFLNIDIDVPCTSLYTFHACTDFELSDSCIDEFLNIVVQATTKPSFATILPSILQALDWTPPFDLECNIECKRLRVG
ncbi:hypothetical protein Lal_00043654, partial [Lupinus albus]